MLAAACQYYSLWIGDFKCHNKTSAFCQYKNMQEMIGFHQTDACGLSYLENEVKLILRHYVCCMCLTAESEAASMPLRRHLKRAKSNKTWAVKTPICQMWSISLPQDALSALGIIHMHVNQTCQRSRDRRNADKCWKSARGKTFYWHIKWVFWKRLIKRYMWSL